MVTYAPHFGAKIAFITNENKLGIHSQRLIQESQNRGHEVTVFQPGSTALKVGKTGNLSITHQTEDGIKKIKPGQFDIAVPQIGSEENARASFDSFATLRHFEAMNTPVLNTAENIQTTNDKLRAHQKFAQHGIPSIATFFTNAWGRFKPFKHSEELIVKGIEGAESNGINKTDHAGLKPLTQKIDLAANPQIAQPFEKSAKGADYGLYIMRDKGGKLQLTGTMLRKAGKDDFRADPRLGGSVHMFEPTKEDTQLAIKTAEILGLNLARVDMLKTDKGSKIIEANAMPGYNELDHKKLVSAAVDTIEGMIQHSK